MVDATPVERHPFAPFMPPRARFLLIGTFPGWQFTQPTAVLGPDDWYYGTHTRSLWHLLEQVYHRPLPTAAVKQALLTDLRLGVTDVVASARRKKVGARDADLYDVQFQAAALAKLLLEHPLEQLFFTSQLAQKWFNGLASELIGMHGVPAARVALPQQVLPSPSPEYIRFKHDTVEGRLNAYRQLLPVLS